MSYVRGFAPWICYAALSAFDWRLGMCAAAFAALILVAGQLRNRSVDLLGRTTCAYFVAMAAVALADPASGLHHWTTALASGTLAVVALASLAARRPFTLSIARTMVPEAYWRSRRFLHVNMVITGAWAAAFTSAAIVCALIVGYGHANIVALVTVQVLAFVIPFAFSGRYTARAQASVREPVADAAV